MNMTKTHFLFLSIILYIGTSKAQDENRIIGRWRVVFANNGVCYNYKTQSYTITKKFADSLVGNKDSSDLYEKHSSFVSQYNDFYFIFAEDGNYKEIQNEEIRTEGVYKINQKNNTINFIVSKWGKDRPINIRYQFGKSNLKIYLTSFFLRDPVELTLEKTEMK